MSAFWYQHNLQISALYSFEGLGAHAAVEHFQKLFEIQQGVAIFIELIVNFLDYVLLYVLLLHIDEPLQLPHAYKAIFVLVALFLTLFVGTAREMEYTKHVISGKYGSLFYVKKGENVSLSDCVLVGFKEDIPVLSNRMEATKGSDLVRNNTLRVEIDSETGEKYIRLNGKKLKMVTAPELRPQLKTKALLSKKSVKVKILGRLPSVLHGATKIKNSDANNATCKLNVNNPRDSSCPDNELSEKLIKKCKIPTVKNPIVIASTSQTNKDSELAVNKLGDTKTYQADKMKTFELKRVVKTVDRCVQTEANELVSHEVQTENEKDPFLYQGPSLSLLEDCSSLSSLDLLEFFDTTRNAPFEQPPVKVLPNIELANSQKVQMFFHDLKNAEQPDNKGNMPIHIGVLTNDLNYVKRCCNILKALQKAVDILNHGDLTALQLAILNDTNTEIIKTLLLNGASLDVTDSEANNIVHLAVEFEQKEVLQIILKTAEARNFNLNQFNAEGLTPLMICCMNRSHDCADILLQYRADPNIRDTKSGRTALFHAAENHDVNMVQLLLKYNADTKIKNFFGTSPHDAMYEVDEMPDQIKSAILGRNLKRKAVDDPKILKTVLKSKRVDENQKQLKTYARFQKISGYEFQKNMTAK